MKNRGVFGGVLWLILLLLTFSLFFTNDVEAQLFRGRFRSQSYSYSSPSKSSAPAANSQSQSTSQPQTQPGTSKPAPKTNVTQAQPKANTQKPLTNPMSTNRNAPYAMHLRGTNGKSVTFYTPDAGKTYRTVDGLSRKSGAVAPSQVSNAWISYGDKANPNWQRITPDQISSFHFNPAGSKAGGSGSITYYFKQTPNGGYYQAANGQTRRPVSSVALPAQMKAWVGTGDIKSPKWQNLGQYSQGPAKLNLGNLKVTGAIFRSLGAAAVNQAKQEIAAKANITDAVILGSPDLARRSGSGMLELRVWNLRQQVVTGLGKDSGLLGADGRGTSGIQSVGPNWLVFNHGQVSRAYKSTVDWGRKLADSFGVPKDSPIRDVSLGAFDWATTAGNLAAARFTPSIHAKGVKYGAFTDWNLPHETTVAVKTISPVNQNIHVLGLSINSPRIHQGQLTFTQPVYDNQKRLIANQFKPVLEPYRVVERMVAGQWEASTGRIGPYTIFKGQAHNPNVNDLGKLVLSPDRIIMEGKGWKQDGMIRPSPIEGLKVISGQLIIAGNNGFNPNTHPLYRQNSDIEPFVKIGDTFVTNTIDRFDQAIGVFGQGRTMLFARQSEFSVNDNSLKGDIYAGIPKSIEGSLKSMKVYWAAVSQTPIAKDMLQAPVVSLANIDPVNPFPQGQAIQGIDKEPLLFVKQAAYSIDKPGIVTQTPWEFTGRASQTIFKAAGDINGLKQFTDLAKINTQSHAPKLSQPPMPEPALVPITQTDKFASLADFNPQSFDFASIDVNAEKKDPRLDIIAPSLEKLEITFPKISNASEYAYAEETLQMFNVPGYSMENLDGLGPKQDLVISKKLFNGPDIEIKSLEFKLSPSAEQIEIARIEKIFNEHFAAEELLGHQSSASARSIPKQEIDIVESPLGGGKGDPLLDSNPFNDMADDLRDMGVYPEKGSSPAEFYIAKQLAYFVAKPADSVREISEAIVSKGEDYTDKVVTVVSQIKDSETTQKVISQAAKIAQYKPENTGSQSIIKSQYSKIQKPGLGGFGSQKPNDMADFNADPKKLSAQLNIDRAMEKQNQNMAELVKAQQEIYIVQVMNVNTTKVYDVIRQDVPVGNEKLRGYDILDKETGKYSQELPQGRYEVIRVVRGSAENPIVERKVYITTDKRVHDWIDEKTTLMKPAEIQVWLEGAGWKARIAPIVEASGNYKKDSTGRIIVGIEALTNDGKPKGDGLKYGDDADEILKTMPPVVKSKIDMYRSPDIVNNNDQALNIAKMFGLGSDAMRQAMENNNAERVSAHVNASYITPIAKPGKGELSPSEQLYAQQKNRTQADIDLETKQTMNYYIEQGIKSKKAFSNILSTSAKDLGLKESEYYKVVGEIWWKRGVNEKNPGAFGLTSFYGWKQAYSAAKEKMSGTSKPAEKKFTQQPPRPAPIGTIMP
ncbi:MAG: hypothetical protein ABH872_00705 [Candidatus Omnitrophota bacterium]